MQRSPCISYVLSISRSTFSELAGRMIVGPQRSTRTSLGRDCKTIKLWTALSIVFTIARSCAFLSRDPRPA